MWVAIEFFFWKASHVIIAVPLTCCLWESAASRERSEQTSTWFFVIFFCATRSATRRLPVSLPLPPFFLTSTFTWLDVWDFMLPQSASRPEEDVGVATAWKAVTWNGIEEWFSATAETRLSSVCAGMTAHITPCVRACEASCICPPPPSRTRLSPEVWPQPEHCAWATSDPHRVSTIKQTSKKLPRVIHRLVVMPIQVELLSLLLALEKKHFMIEVVCPITL